MLFAHKYDELGRRVQKTLAPQYNNGQGLETLNFDFNIKGWLTGINKDYALGEYNSDQWEHYFGIYIGYDNRDNKFSNGLLNGNITGVQWKSQGDNTPRKYEYEYDNLDRLTKATFTQKGNSSEGWNNSRLDYTVKDIAYDANGNLFSMTNMGTLLGSASKVEIDKLSYVYKPLSNRLTRIDDLSTTGASNGKSGDFKDGTNTGSTDDYDYDLNGNLSLDRNKEIRTGSAKGVTYNIFDKPVSINVEGKGHIRYVYDGGGSGRASADVSKIKLTDVQIVAKRDAFHHIKGFSAAKLDQASYDRYSIRGREQQLIDYNGGAQSDLGSPRKSGNPIRGVSRWNKKGMMYWLASTREFGLLFRFTGYFQ